MKIIKTSPGCHLFLGHKDEKLALQIVFDIGPWLETYGFGTAHLIHQRKGDAEPYPVGTVQEGSQVLWNVSDADTAVEGAGHYELHFYNGESRVKAVTGDTLVAGALPYGADPPEPVQLWLDHVAEEEHKIYQAVTDTKTAKTAAEAAAVVSQAAQSGAETAQRTAEDAAVEAGTKASAALQAAASANASRAAAEQAKADAEAAAASSLRSKNDAARLQAETGQMAGQTSVFCTDALNARNKAVAAAENADQSAQEASRSNLLAYERSKEALTYANQSNESAKNAKTYANEAKKAAESASGGMGGADWNAAKGEPGHVLNRTHWVERKDVLLYENDSIHTSTSGYTTEIELPFEIVEGKTYTVEIDGEVYFITGHSKVSSINGATGTFSWLGNASKGMYASLVDGAEDTGEPFVIERLEDDATRLESAWFALKDSTVSVKITGINETIHKLPGKFLPEGVPYVEGGMVEILPETDYQLDEEGFGGDVPVVFVADETYSINWNGTEYICVAQDASALMPGAILIGNGANFGMYGNGEPFIAQCVPSENMCNFVALDGTASTNITLSICQKTEIIHKLPGKFLPEGVPYVENGITELLPETDASNFTHPSFGKMWAIYGVTVDLKVGETYTVTYNGTPYACVCQAAPAGLIEDPNAVAMGNFSVVGGANTGEPFAMLVSFVYQEVDIIDLVGSGAVKVKIVGVGEIAHKIDSRCLPPTYKSNTSVITVREAPINLEIINEYEEITKAIKSGKNVILHFYYNSRIHEYYHLQEADLEPNSLYAIFARIVYHQSSPYTDFIRVSLSDGTTG